MGLPVATPPEYYGQTETPVTHVFFLEKIHASVKHIHHVLSLRGRLLHYQPIATTHD